MVRTSVFLFAFAAFLVPTMSFAEIYKCTDKNGSWHFSDTRSGLPESCRRKARVSETPSESSKKQKKTKIAPPDKGGGYQVKANIKLVKEKDKPFLKIDGTVGGGPICASAEVKMMAKGDTMSRGGELDEITKEFSANIGSIGGPFKKTFLTKVEVTGADGFRTFNWRLIKTEVLCVKESRSQGQDIW
ncbi:MAG: DUF4124 domain-containing protein [Nitrospinota bacterium]